MAKAAAGLFRELATRLAPRVLGLGDRNPASPTCGCYDRAYWKYLLADFPSGWFQAAGWYLAELYACPPGSSPFARHPQVRSWALEAMGYTISIAHPDGSIDEAYPYERSYCTSAFCLAWITQGLLILEAGVLAGLERLGAWVAAQPLPEASNQAAAAVLGLAGMWRLSGQERWRRAAERICQGLVASCTQGYFPEYGGLDAGYLSLSMSLLARARELGVQGLEEALAEAGRVMERCVGPYGEIAPWARHRGTQYLYPAGLVEFAPAALERLAEGLTAAVAIEPSWLDDRYFIPLAGDYLAAARIIEGRGS